MLFSRRLALGLTLALASIGLLAATALAGTISPTVTASGTPGISATVRVINTTTGLVDLHFSVTQPANICRTLTGPDACPFGSLYDGHVYPNWSADLTISGLDAAGLTYASSNGGWAEVSDSGGTVVLHTEYLNNYFKTFDVYFTPSANSGGAVTANLIVSDKTATDAPPTSKDQCKLGGWSSFNTLSFTAADNGYLPVWTPSFANQGTCVSYVETGRGNG